MKLTQIEDSEYWVNDLGQFDPFHAVLSTKKWKGKLLHWRKPSIHKGHWFIPQVGNVHVLLAKAFIPNPENKEIVHHINGNPLDNRLENLMWVTRSQHRAIHNIGNTYASALKGTHLKEETKQKIREANLGKKASEETRMKMRESQSKKAVEQWSLDGTTLIERYKSASEAQRKTGICSVNIGACCRKVKYYYSAGGYTWRYAD